MKFHTPRGEVDSSELVMTSGLEDSPRYFGPWEEYRFPDGDLAARLEVRDPALGGFLKANPFYDPPPDVDADGNVPVLVAGEMTTRKLSELVRTVGQADSPNEFACWVEYRLPGSDVIVKRSADTKLKRQPVSAAAVPGKLER